MPTPKDRANSQQTTISASTSETTIVTADPYNRNCLSQLVITTPNTAIATMTLKDGTAGITRAVFDYPNAASAPSAPFVVNFDPPLLQAATNANWTLTCSANAGSVKVLASFVAQP